MGRGAEDKDAPCACVHTCVRVCMYVYMCVREDSLPF